MKMASVCGHTDREDFAKGLCCSCYKRQRRQRLGLPIRIKKNAWICEHKDRPNHTRGLCEPCAKLKSYYLDVDFSRKKGKESRIRNKEQRRQYGKIYNEKRRDYLKQKYRDNKQQISLKMTCSYI